jgi:hypothetical protein
MKEIPLSRGKIALVDDEDYSELAKFKWCAHPNPSRIFYATRNMPNGKSRKTIRMHRVILPPPPGKEIDHINGNGLDNRKENLRIVTRRVNQQNQHVKKHSKYPGVTWHKTSKKWLSQIRMPHQKQRYLGMFENELDAATTYLVACAVLCKGE